MIVFLSFFPPAMAVKIVLINPDKPGRPFWDLTTKVAQAAADDLNVDLTILYGGGNRFSNMDLLDDIKRNHTDIDYIIFLPAKGSVKRSFDVLEKAKLPFITLERNFSDKDFSQLGSPGTRYNYWLDEVYYDDMQAGALLANNLISSGSNKGFSSLFITGFSGDNSEISDNREKGLLANLTNQAQLNQIVRTLWDPVKSGVMVPHILKRYPATNIFWAASDEIALAIKDALSKNNNTKDILIGGIGWLPEAIDAIKNEQLTASVGGHFMQGAWAVIKAFDHSQGFQDISTKNSLPLLHQVINKRNIKQYQVLASKPNWDKIDFTLYSLSLNKKLTQYNFALDEIILALQ